MIAGDFGCVSVLRCMMSVLLSSLASLSGILLAIQGHLLRVSTDQLLLGCLTDLRFLHMRLVVHTHLSPLRVCGQIVEVHVS